jgi:hypothetical protein
VGVFDRVPVAATEEDSLWWLGLLIPLLLLCFLLPLLVYLKKKPKKEKAPVPTEEPDQIELEKPLPEEAHLVQTADADAAKPASSPPKKWKVVSSAYIGYGKGKMDVDWAGDAPASAPHALKRFQVQEGASAVAGQAHNEEDGELHNVSLDVSPGEMHAGFSTQDEYERYSCAQLVFGCACFKKKKKKDLAAKSGAFVPTQPKQSKALKAQAAAEQTEEEQRASRASATAAIAAALRDSIHRDMQPAAAPAAPSFVAGAGKPTAAAQPNNTYIQTAAAPAQAVPVPVFPPAAAPTPAAQPGLPAGWEMLHTAEGTPYFENRELQVTQWHRPT